MSIYQTTRKVALLIFAVLMFESSYSQTNYLPGNIITLQDDTIKGFIDFRRWEANPYNVDFKNNLESDVIQYSPLDIKAFSVSDENYIGGIYEKEASPSRARSLDFEAKLNIAIDTVFLRTIVDGPKSLYYFKDKELHDNFYIRKKDTYELLLFKEYLKRQDGKDNVVQSKKYIGQLLLYLGDTPGIQSKINRTKYNLSSLEGLFVDYYRLAEPERQLKPQKKGAKVQIGLISGVSMTTMKFLGSRFHTKYRVLIDGTYSNSLNYTGGLSFAFIFPRDLGRWSIVNDLLYTTYEVQGEFEKYRLSRRVEWSSSDFGFSYLKLYTMLRFKQNINNWSFFVNAGISNGLMQQEKTAKMNYNGGRDVRVYNKARNYEQGYMLGLGGRFKRYSLEMRYEKSDGMLPTADFNAIVSKFFLLAGYRFY